MANWHVIDEEEKAGVNWVAPPESVPKRLLVWVDEHLKVAIIFEIVSNTHVRVQSNLSCSHLGVSLDFGIEFLVSLWCIFETNVVGDLQA